MEGAADDEAVLRFRSRMQEVGGEKSVSHVALEIQPDHVFVMIAPRYLAGSLPLSNVRTH